VFRVAVIDEEGLVFPATTVRLTGLGEDRVKPNGATTCNVIAFARVTATPPPTALMVTLVEPRAAVDVAVNETVTVHVGLHGLLPKLAVMPVGSGPVEKVMGVVVPDARVAVIEEVGLVKPCTTVRLLGEGGDSVNVKGAATVSDNDVVWVTPPPTALIVTVLVPRVAAGVAENKTVTVQVGLHGLLVKIAVTPVGRADVEKVTGVGAPPVRVAVIEDDGLVEPWMTVRLFGEGADNVKLKAGG
jgi:hypothetical protein